MPPAVLRSFLSGRCSLAAARSWLLTQLWANRALGVTEQDVRATADAMVATGMKDAGYEYVVRLVCRLQLRGPASG